MASSVAAEYNAVPPFPDELLETIFYHFSGTTVGRAHAVCRKWNGMLLALTSSTEMWFRRCKEEIPKYTLMQMCNHPLEPRYRSRVEWKDVYVRWRRYRGKTLLERAELEPKMVISKDADEMEMEMTSPYSHYRLCFTDDVAFFYDGWNMVAYDMHSGASVKKKIHVTTYRNGSSSAVMIHTLGMTVPINVEGKTSFEANVEKSVLVILMDYHFEILIGLESKFAVSPPCAEVGPLSTWYDTILVKTEGHGGDKLEVYRVHLLAGGGTKPVFVDHIQTIHLNAYGDVKDLLLTGNKTLILLEETDLMMWDIAKGEEYQSLSLTRQADEFLCRGLMSWEGSTVAVTLFKGIDENIPVIVLYFLDEECEMLQSITRLDPQDSISAFGLLYDDSLIMINNDQCNLLLFTRGDQNAGNWSRDKILECSPVQQANGHNVQIEQDGEHGNDSSAPKSRDATCDTVDEAHSYKRTMSNLLEIDVGDPLWKNFDAETNDSKDFQVVDTCSHSSDSDLSEQENDIEGSCSSREEYVIERWKEGRKDHALSHSARGSVIQKPILSVPHQGYNIFHWRYFFTCSSVAIEPTLSQNGKLPDRLFVYKWNFKQ